MQHSLEATSTSCSPAGQDPPEVERCHTRAPGHTRPKPSSKKGPPETKERAGERRRRWAAAGHGTHRDPDSPADPGREMLAHADARSQRDKLEDSCPPTVRSGSGLTATGISRDIYMSEDTRSVNGLVILLSNCHS
ncbi:Hypothetical predicted protein [Pelobates cultripes]|uniref:Uncharacterized protein n=1 Tax=Pelobates cultripes TaxID=61616 RepID=A0AAD1RYT5_PELCU|nr:Hypothetical predicted protein [Pelobates cultripes]